VFRSSKAARSRPVKRTRRDIPAAIVISYSYWQRHGSDPHLPGKTLRINGGIFTVIGIAAEGFTGTMALISSESFLPLGMYSLLANEIEGRGHSLRERGNPHLILIGRLKPGLTKREADAQLAVAASQMEKAYPAENKDQTFTVHPLCRPSETSSGSTRHVAVIDKLAARAGVANWQCRGQATPQ
jgi:hypothetical protein